MDGVLIINKEKGYTSFDVVAKLRGILGQKKIGHLGTLDPEAEGVLPVLLGRATKLASLLSEGSKVYRTVLYLGAETDTQDACGKVLAHHLVSCSEEEVRAAVRSFLGRSRQLTPMYSARKVGGNKLVDLARRGVEVERSSEEILIKQLEILDIHLPRVVLRVRCSKGTYIRTLCADIGEKLECGGTMKSLVRTKVGRFTLEQAHTLSELEKIRDEGLEKQAPEGRAAGLESVLIPTEIVFEDLKRVCTLPEADKYLLNGNAIPAEKTVIKANATAETKANGAVVGNVAYGGLAGNLDGAAKKVTGSIRNGERVRMCTSEGNFLGVFEYSGHERSFRPVKMFL